jgi:hypothetical protein
MKVRKCVLLAERLSVSMAIVLGPRLVIAGSLNDTIRPATEIVRFISGPLATVLVTFGLVGALVSLIFFGGQMIGRLLTSFFSGIALFMIERITQAIGDLAR